MRRARAFAALLGATILLALPLATRADTPGADTGFTGAHHLVDTPTTPGAWCGDTTADEYPLLHLVRVEGLSRQPVRNHAVPGADEPWESCFGWVL